MRQWARHALANVAGQRHFVSSAFLSGRQRWITRPDPENPIQLKKEQHDLPTFSHPVEQDVRKPQPKPPNPLVNIENATFYRRQPSPSATEGGEEAWLNKPLFPGLHFAHPSSKDEGQFWAVVGPSNAGKTTFLEILRGHHLCFPPRARSYPYLSSDEILLKDHRLSYAGRAIQYVGFDNRQKGLSGVGAHLGARYESRREATDFSVHDFLTGNIQLNAAEDSAGHVDEALLDKVLYDLNLSNLVQMPVANLSNGQTRRARIAKALLQKPELLLLDEPFMGLDPPTLVHLSPILRQLAQSGSPRVLLALRPQDPIPDWITHMVYLGENLKVTHQGPKPAVYQSVIEDHCSVMESSTVTAEMQDMPYFFSEFGQELTDFGVTSNPALLTPKARKIRERTMRILGNDGVDNYTNYEAEVKMGFQRGDRSESTKWDPKFMFPIGHVGEPLLEMNGVSIKYGDKTVLGDWNKQYDLLYEHWGSKLLCEQGADGGTAHHGLRWTIRQGERWAVVGSNGSGKTTLLSLILSDHPQAYAAPMKVFGRSRLPTLGQPGISLFDIQAQIGHSSPEVHSFFPRHLTVRQTLESAYADTPNSPPRINADADARVDACLRWFQGELNPAIGMDQWLKDETTKRYGNSVKIPLRSQNKEAYKRLHAKLWNDFAEKQARAIEWADSMRFSDMTFSGQRVALFLRAIIAQPEIVLLDEAFSGMDDRTRDKCQLFLEYGERARQSVRLLTKEEIVSLRRKPLPSKYLVHFRRPSELNNTFTIKEGLTDKQALIAVSHVKEEVPMSVRDVLFLPEAGTDQPCTFAKIRMKNLCRDAEMWHTIWNVARYQRGKGGCEEAERLMKVGEKEEEAVRERRPAKFAWPGGVQEARRVLLKGGPGAMARKEREKEEANSQVSGDSPTEEIEKPRRNRRSKNGETVAEDLKDEADVEAEKPKRKRRSKKADSGNQAVKDKGNGAVEKPKWKRKTRKEEAVEEDGQDGEEAEVEKPKNKGGRPRKKRDVDEDADV